VVRIEAGAGNDLLYGEGVAGAVLSGEGGDDLLSGGNGGQEHDGGAGFDTVSYAMAGGGVTVDFGDGSQNRGEAAGDTYASIEAVQGSRFDDVLRLAGAVRTADAGAGNDVVQGSAQADEIRGGDGADWIEGGAGADVMDGGAGVDWLSYLNSGAGVRVDLVAGVCSGGDAQGDRITNLENVTGSHKADVLIGNNAANTLEGNAGDDEIRGGGGADTLRGGDGDDRLFGEAGSDMLVGGAGTNRLNGGAGADLFQVSRIGMQIVEDFARGQDRIYLQASEFGTILSDRRVGADDFASGARVDFTGRHAGFFFETGTSTLYFDGDGQGGQAAEAIARISNVQQLQTTDFVVA
jgi:Ca2+-binding RTX toxin-like protein